MKKAKKKRSIWQAIGKIFRGRKGELPEGADFCDMCGRIYPEEDLHHVVEFFGTKEEFILCEDCIELPPTQWRRNKDVLRKKHSIH